MAWLDTIPFWLLGIGIFCLRIVDVSVGTLRTISMVRGRTQLSVMLGFFEVLIWIVAVSQVVVRIDDMPWLAPFYAGGFASGVGVGMMIERRLALGLHVVRIISRSHAAAITAALRDRGHVLASFAGATAAGPVHLLFVSAKGPQVQEVVAAARAVDPDLFFLVEAATEWSENVYPLSRATGVRALFTAQ